MASAAPVVPERSRPAGRRWVPGCGMLRTQQRPSGARTARRALTDRTLWQGLCALVAGGTDSAGRGPPEASAAGYLLQGFTAQRVNRPGKKTQMIPRRARGLPSLTAVSAAVAAAAEAWQLEDSGLFCKHEIRGVLTLTPCRCRAPSNAPGRGEVLPGLAANLGGRVPPAPPFFQPSVHILSTICYFKEHILCRILYIEKCELSILEIVP